MTFKTLLESIGNTPLVKIPLATKATVLAKLEYLNPGGSVKDRSALYMIEQAEKLGLLKPGGTIVEASSGNQGIALSMIGAIKGYRVIITVSEKFSQEKIKTLKAYGVEVITCPKTRFIDDPDNYHMRAKAIAQSITNSFMPDQYNNIENRNAHYALLGPEVWKQTEGTITHFFAAAGTGGTISGVGKYLKEQNPNIVVYGVDAVNSYHSTKGNPKPYELEGIGIDFDSKILDTSVTNEIIGVSDEEAIYALKYAASKQGLLVGPSSGAVIAAVLKKLPEFKEGDVVVMVCGDSGRAYLSKHFYEHTAQEDTLAATVKNNQKPLAL